MGIKQSRLGPFWPRNVTPSVHVRLTSARVHVHCYAKHTAFSAPPAMHSCTRALCTSLILFGDARIKDIVVGGTNVTGKVSSEVTKVHVGGVAQVVSHGVKVVGVHGEEGHGKKMRKCGER